MVHFIYLFIYLLTRANIGGTRIILSEYNVEELNDYEIVFCLFYSWTLVKLLMGVLGIYQCEDMIRQFQGTPQDGADLLKS
jgi:hypothetical protein